MKVELKQNILNAQEINYIIANVHDKVKQYSTVSDHVLKTVLNHMLIEGLNDITADRKTKEEAVGE